MHNLAVIGDLNSVIGYRALGMTVIATEDTAVAETELKRLANEGYSVVYVTENLVDQNPNLLELYRTDQLPAVIVIPASSGFLNLGLKNLRSQVKRAVGMDLMKDIDNQSEEEDE